MPDQRFDEVMIVNPGIPGHEQGVRLMHGYGFFPGYGHPGSPGGLGWYGEPQEPYGYAEAPDLYGYGKPDPYLGEPSDAYGYAEAPELFGYGAYGYGGYGFGGYADPGWGGGAYGEYAEAPELYGYGEPDPSMGEPQGAHGYAEAPDLYGYGEAPEFADYAEHDPALAEAPETYGYAEPAGDYGDADGIAGYVREQHPGPWNPGCPMPSNVRGLGETADPREFAGLGEAYTSPPRVSPECQGLRPPTVAPPSSSSDMFRPLF